VPVQLSSNNQREDDPFARRQLGDKPAQSVKLSLLLADHRIALNCPFDGVK
jgi:hypothetical protein